MATVPATKIWSVLALCAAFLAAPDAAAAPLKVVGRFLQDAHGNNIMMRGVNLPVYKSGYADDLDAVAAAIALTKTNTVRLEWWAVPLGGQTEYTVANFDRAIQKFYDLGIIPVVELHDLTFDYFQGGPPGGPNSRSNDRTVFANTITAFWTLPDIVAILVKHQDHLVINLANEWGATLYKDGANNDVPSTAAAAAANFIQNYTDAIAAIRAAGIIAPLMVDAPKGFEYQFLLDHGPALLAADPQANTMLSTHSYWAATVFSDGNLNTILDNFKNSGLPVVLGEASSNSYTNIPCDPVHYPNLLAHANVNEIGYLFWAWYEDGQCGQEMNITVGPPPGGLGVTLPTVAGFGYDALYGPGYGIDVALPATRKADFSPVGVVLVNTSFGYNVTSTNDNVMRAAAAQVTRLNNFGAEKRPVVVLMPGWGGAGDVAAAQNAQAIMFANAGYVALNIGFHQTGNAPGGALAAWYSDLAESAKGALDALCAQAYADCSAVVLTGESYGGTQTHPVVRYLRAVGAYDGSGAANAGRRVVGLLGQDSGYSLYWTAPVNADATAYSIAMIENLGDGDFPVDSCAFGNCGARNRADYHQAAAGSQYVLSYCPAGGTHGSRGYADWDAWVLSAVKAMLHNQRGVSKFTGYAEPSLVVSNACLTTPLSFGLTVTPAGTGTGTVTSSPAGINCGAACTANFNSGESVTLTGSAAAGSTFSGWSGGGCSGTGNCVVTMSAATTLTATFTLTTSLPRMVNISTRGRALTGNSVLIGGFAITGSTKKVLVVARGPTVVAGDIQPSERLANPRVTLVGSNLPGGVPYISNDDWQTSSNAADITGTGKAPSNALESAILIDLQPGNYTAIVDSGTVGATGIGIVEIYEIDTPGAPLVNISTRGRVMTGNSFLIGGFAVSGASKRVLILARGPTVVAGDIQASERLANPRVTLVGSNLPGGVPYISNDDWQSATNASDIAATGKQPSNALESAILIDLQPGNYTAIVDSGTVGATGIGIIEVYAQ